MLALCRALCVCPCDAHVSQLGSYQIPYSTAPITASIHKAHLGQRDRRAGAGTAPHGASQLNEATGLW